MSLHLVLMGTLMDWRLEICVSMPYFWLSVINWLCYVDCNTEYRYSRFFYVSPKFPRLLRVVPLFLPGYSHRVERTLYAKTQPGLAFWIYIKQHKVAIAI